MVETKVTFQSLTFLYVPPPPTSLLAREGGYCLREAGLGQGCLISPWGFGFG